MLPPDLETRFEARRLVGQGGMGRVVQAHDRTLGRSVAIKLMLVPDEAARARFQREGAALAALRHPAVLEILELGETDGNVFLVTEYIEGQSLDRGIPGDGDPVEMMMQVAEGIQAVHDAGLIHRDVKPSNIMVDANGRAVLVDFGLVFDANRTALTATGDLLGTPLYLPPEVLRAERAGNAADWYGWGLTLFEILEGFHPFREAAMEQGILDMHDAPPEFLTLQSGDPLKTMLSACLHPDPQQRPQNYAELVSLRSGRAIPGSGRKWPGTKEPRTPVAASIPLPPTSSGGAPKSRLRIAAASLSLAAVMGLIASFVIYRPHDDPAWVKARVQFRDRIQDILAKAVRIHPRKSGFTAAHLEEDESGELRLTRTEVDVVADGVIEVVTADAAPTRYKVAGKKDEVDLEVRDGEDGMVTFRMAGLEWDMGGAASPEYADPDEILIPAEDDLDMAALADLFAPEVASEPAAPEARPEPKPKPTAPPPAVEPPPPATQVSSPVENTTEPLPLDPVQESEAVEAQDSGNETQAVETEEEEDPVGIGFTSGGRGMGGGGFGSDY